MKYNLYGIRDVKANYFWQPQVQVNDAVAKREFSMMINSSEARQATGFAPGDFDLYKLGVFDSESGYVEAIVPAEFIVNGLSIKEVPDQKKGVKKVAK